MKWPRSDPSKFHAICLLSQAYTVLSISVIKRVKMTQNKHIAYNQNGVVSGGARKKVPGQPHYVKTGRIQHCGCDGKCRMHARWLRSAFDRLSQDYMSLVAHSLPETPINVIGSLYGQVKVIVEFCKATVWFFSYLSGAKFCVCSLHRPWRRHHTPVRRRSSQTPLSCRWHRAAEHWRQSGLANTGSLRNWTSVVSGQRVRRLSEMYKCLHQMCMNFSYKKWPQNTWKQRWHMYMRHAWAFAQRHVFGHQVATRQAEKNSGPTRVSLAIRYAAGKRLLILVLGLRHRTLHIFILQHEWWWCLFFLSEDHYSPLSFF